MEDNQNSNILSQLNRSVIIKGSSGVLLRTKDSGHFRYLTKGSTNPSSITPFENLGK